MSAGQALEERGQTCLPHGTHLVWPGRLSQSLSPPQTLPQAQDKTCQPPL